MLPVLIAALALAGCLPSAPWEQPTPAATPTSAPTEAPTLAPTPTLAGDDVVLTWQREGGIAGFCDELVVYADGTARLTSCDELVAETNLPSEVMEQVLAWVEVLQPLQWEQSDDAVADAMTVRLTLEGRGAREATDDEVQAMLDLAASLVQPRAPTTEGATLEATSSIPIFAGKTPATPASVADPGPGEGYANLIDNLRAGGSVEEAGQVVSQSFFSPQGRLIRLNGEDIQVFEYQDQEAAASDAALVASDGSSVGTSMVTWVATPHFYRANQLIVLYVGDNADILARLESALGPQFAGGERLTGLRPVPVAAVTVEVGVGSPIPVDIFVSGSWPDLCAQLAEVKQEFREGQIETTLLATPADPDCPPDYLGIPFRIAIPLNVVELPEGEYTITVNGVSTTFEWPVRQ